VDSLARDVDEVDVELCLNSWTSLALSGRSHARAPVSRELTAHEPV
jgi:hypothetical protein